MRFRRSDHLDDQLRRRRSSARDTFVDAVASEIPEAPGRAASRVRTGLALALTVGALGAVSAFGGVSYAKSAFQQVTGTVHAAVVQPAHVTVHHSITPADGQYCHGDDCHHHHHHHHHKKHHHKKHHHHHHHHKKHHRHHHKPPT
jgi:hypothetical protein